IETVDDRTFTVSFDPPLAGGQVGVRWKVQAADAHPIEGAFSFTVSAPAATTTVATTTPATTVVAGPADDTTDTEAPTTGDDETVAAPSPDAQTPTDTDAAAAPPVVDGDPPNDATREPSAGTTPATTQSLDEFLAVDDSTPGETTATVGRLVGFLGVALGLGAFAFVGTAMRGRRREIRRLLVGVRALGLVIAGGAAIEYVGVARIGAESLGSAWSTAPGFATALRAIGGLGLAVGLAGTITRGRVQRLIRRPSVARSLSSAVVDDVALGEDALGSNRLDDPIVRWSPDSRSWPALAGTLLVIASFWFDGHTVSKGFRPLHGLVNSIHVAAGAVWVGGVATMAVVAWMRYRDHRPMRMVELVVRFSKIASIALASVVAAGAVMAFLVLDSFGELTGTPWGKILLLKTAAVGLAMMGGAYNHFRLLPALEAEPDSPELLAQLRSTVTAEAIMLAFVVSVTAWLVAAAS
ncbi:MAG: CopD family protein, partial [Actinomycetota bacterium]